MQLKIILFFWINIKGLLGLCMLELDRGGVNSMFTLHLGQLASKAI